MGGDKSTSKQTTQQTAQYTPTPQESALESNQLAIQQAGQAGQISMNQNASNLVNTLLTGGQLPGNLAGAMGVSDSQTQSMVNASLRDIYPQFQSQGILDSGVAAQIASRTAADVRNQNAQFNVQALQQLLNQGLGGQASVQQPMNQNTSTLMGGLSGLRSFSGTNNQQGSTMGMNPFLKSFQNSAGSTFGKIGGTAVGNFLF